VRASEALQVLLRRAVAEHGFVDAGPNRTPYFFRIFAIGSVLQAVYFDLPVY
jgi:hypothetical protein